MPINELVQIVFKKYWLFQLMSLIFCCLFQSCKSVYDRIIDLKIATPQIIINFGLFLEEHNYFEEAFRVSCKSCFMMLHYMRRFLLKRSIFFTCLIYMFSLIYNLNFLSYYFYTGILNSGNRGK